MVWQDGQESYGSKGGSVAQAVSPVTRANKRTKYISIDKSLVDFDFFSVHSALPECWPTAACVGQQLSRGGNVSGRTFDMHGN